MIVVPDLPASKRNRIWALAHLFSVLVAVILWLIGLFQIDPAAMNDLGLVSVLPPIAYAGLLLLTLSYTVLLQHNDMPRVINLLHVIVLIFILYGSMTLLEEMPRFGVNWRHVGIIDYITRTGSADPSIDAYLNWPSFFIGNSFLAQAAGLRTPLAMVPWSPFIFNLLYLMPVVAILKLALNKNFQAIWLGTWLFYICNWIGQDYYSPQAINYFLYLVVIAVLLRWFKTGGYSLAKFYRKEGWRGRFIQWLDQFLNATDIPAREEQHPSRRIGLLLFIVMIFAASAMSHQLTPFAILGAVAVMVVLNQISPRMLPALMGLILVMWIMYMALPYIQGHIDKLLSELGGISSSLDENVTARLEGSPEHKLIVRIRLITAAGVWGLASLGALWRVWKGQHVFLWGILAVTPFGLMGLQDYGGEMVLRVYLFNLPFMLSFLVSLFYPHAVVRNSWLNSLGIFVVSIVITIGFLFSRYGNERMDYKTVEEVDGMRVLYDIAEPGSLFLALRPNLAWQFESYEIQRHRVMNEALLDNDPEAIVTRMQNWDGQAYLILTRSQQVGVEMFSSIDHTEWKQFQYHLIRAGLKVIYRNPDAVIYAPRDQELTTPIPEALEPLNIWETTYNPVESLIILGFLLIVPGRVVVSALKLDDRLIEWMMSVALSIALIILVPTVLLYMGLWYTALGMIIIVGITIAGAILYFMDPFDLDFAGDAAPIYEQSPQ